MTTIDTPLATRLAFTAVLTTLPVSSALAGATFERGALSGDVTFDAAGAALWSRNVNFGDGRVDLRRQENTGDAADWQEAYLKPGASLRYALDGDWALLASGSLMSSRTFGDGDAGGFTHGGDGRTAVEEAYAGVEWRDWRLTLGRQNYRVGNGFIVMDGNLDLFDDGGYWMGARTAFRDSAVLRWNAEPLSAALFSLESDDDQGDYRLRGINADYRLGASGATLGAMVMAVETLDRPAASLDRDGMRVYNLRAMDIPFPGLPSLRVSGEYARQLGDGHGVDYDATAWYAQADYRFAAAPLTPTLGYRYTHFSGDATPGDGTRSAWDALSKGYTDWGTWLVGDVVGNYLLFNTNENVQQFSATLALDPHWTLGAIHYQFWLDEANYQGRPVADRRFADETTLYLDWLPDPHWYASLAYSRVSPRAGARDVFADDDPFSALEFFVAYHY
ncbi:MULTISPECIES: alginate export family protein [unclassified Modicisalibacter]|uniref:alginate export family protein n=1 Tax=unclassified Modicisalibacter TaxID=2679913 RepID=UPI001CCA769E|nr:MULTISPECIES: alginate export family protein [unclassified Modicisalibacter]MBZ9557641.1 hypothetical protein [Modicisalibacter sp. R2A 31.J]MBZ9573695.1 hypothetical protein [Modicisalibacter sp. MOD 31.J]